MQLLKIYFSDVESYYEVKRLARHILNNPAKLLFYIKNRVIKMCENTHFEDWTTYYWYDLIRNRHYVAFTSNINNHACIKIHISDYELKPHIGRF